MKFTTDSGLVYIWGMMIVQGKKTIDDVPKVYNLRDAVEEFVKEYEAE